MHTTSTHTASSTHPASTAPVVGVDVSKASLSVHIRPSGQAFEVANTPGGIADLCARLLPLAPRLVVLEATGGYERASARALSRHAIPVSVVNPRRTRAYAQALDEQAKTDPIDASVIARFGEDVRPDPTPQPSPEQAERAALEGRRRQLVGMLAMERNHLSSAEESVRGLILEDIARLEGRVAELEAQLRARLAKDAGLRAAQAVLESVKGVGAVTSAMLLIRLPELGKLTAKQIAKLVGVAPFAADSGTKEGKRYCKGGRAEVRAALYMPTMTAIRWNPTIKEFYERLTSKGKTHKVAVIACMRKLLGILNAMMRDGRHWNDRPALSN